LCTLGTAAKGHIQASLDLQKPCLMYKLNLTYTIPWSIVFNYYIWNGCFPFTYLLCPQLFLRF
jgi:hypothetical protein